MRKKKRYCVSMSPDAVDAIKNAADKKGMSFSSYLEQAARSQCEIDGAKIQ